MNIDWEDIEERLAYLEDKPDCIPEDIREWTHFREQYENAVDFIKNYKERDFSKPDMTQEFLYEKLLEIAYLGYGYKKSIFEVLNDNKTDLIPELDWKTIENFQLFFDWDIDLSDQKLKSLPPLPKHVGGNFWCDNNKLTSLEGAPQHVGTHFYCNSNQLTSLESAPQHVGGDFSCANNQLTSLEGAPQHIGEDFWCHNNQLTTLEGAPQHIGENFSCSQNKLTTLEGAPQHVGADFWCHSNQLTTLKGAPQRIGGDFNCSFNQLTTLEGAPQHIGTHFLCGNNKLQKSIPHRFPGKDLPKYINIKESIILSFKDFKKL